MLNWFHQWRKGRLGKVFHRIYRENSWGNRESVSGDGSTLQYTENIRRGLPQLLAQREVRVLLDAPCGDCNWIFQAGLEGIQYIGVDIVPQLIEKNREKYPGHSFLVRDISADPLPPADAVLCRDCFIHLSFAHIFRTLENFRASGIRYLITNTYPGVKENRDIHSGGFRMLDLKQPPFRFPEPRHCLEDYIEGYPVRHLCLWELDRLPLR